MRLSTFCVSLLVTAAAPAARLAAQSAAPVVVGERVRITTPTQAGSHRYVGKVVGMQGDSLTVQTGSAGPKAVAVAEISRVEVSGGKYGNGRRGMLYGALIGTGVGAIAGAATYKKPDCAGTTWFCGSPNGGRGADTFAGGLLGGLVGFAVGGIWGATHPGERWVPGTLGSAAHVGVRPSARGAMLTLSARF